MTTSLMAREIAEQPGLIREKWRRWDTRGEEIRAALPRRKNIALLGRGSSGNACTFASYLFALKQGRHPIEFRPWLSTQTGVEADWSDTIAIAYSSSGESTDIAKSAAWLAARGAEVVAITNAEEDDCRLLRSAQHDFRLEVGPERAIPATKSFLAQLFATAALSGYSIEEHAEETASCMDALLDSEVPKRLAELLLSARHAIWLGRGPILAAALDGALKLQETAGSPSSAWSSAEFLHGPIAAVQSPDRVVVFACGEVPASLEGIEARLVTRGVPFAIVGSLDRGMPTLPVRLPSSRWAATPVLAMLTQMVALEMATARGLDPDSPEGLRKVTLT